MGRWTRVRRGVAVSSWCAAVLVAVVAVAACSSDGGSATQTTVTASVTATHDEWRRAAPSLENIPAAVVGLPDDSG